MRRYKVFCQAKALKDALAETDRMAPEVIEHVIKVISYPDHSARDHWKQEIYSFINKAPILKSTKRYPTKRQYMKAMWESWGDITCNLKRRVEEDYEKISKDIDYKSACYEYVEWLADKLSEIGIVSRRSVYEKLDELTSKYGPKGK